MTDQTLSASNSQKSSGWLGWLALAGTLATGTWLARRRQEQAIIEQKMPGFFRDKVIIITGASSGIGAEFACQLAGLGATPILAARRESRLRALVDDLCELSPDMMMIRTDVSQRDQLENLIQTTLDHYGRIDGLINNAGIIDDAPFKEITLDRLNKILETNLKGSMMLTRLVLPHMLARDQGLIITVSSIQGRLGTPFGSVYVASKYGLTGWEQAIHREYIHTNLQFMLAQPGYTHSEIADAYEHAVGQFGIRLWDTDKVVRLILEGAALGKRTVATGGLERALVFLNWLSPALTDWIHRLFLTEIMHNALSDVHVGHDDAVKLKT